MLYPLRINRHKQQRVKAVVRLLQRNKMLHLERINQKKYPKQPKKGNDKHIQFSGKTVICRYDPKVK